MQKRVILIFILCMFCTGCSKTDEPFYDLVRESELIEMNTKSDILLLQGYHMVKVTIHPTQYYREEEAIAIIKEYCEQEESLYDYEAPPEGCVWEAVKYTLSYKQNDMFDPYVNIKLVDINGMELCLEGKSYTKRTNDILISSKEQDGMIWKELYCYYVVPQECISYALEFGDGTIYNDEESVYYVIRR